MGRHVERRRESLQGWRVYELRHHERTRVEYRVVDARERRWDNVVRNAEWREHVFSRRMAPLLDRRRTAVERHQRLDGRLERTDLGWHSRGPGDIQWRRGQRAAECATRAARVDRRTG